VGTCPFGQLLFGDDGAGEAFFFLEFQMNEVATVNSSGTNNMTSVEIAELTGKQHKHVMADIVKMLEQLQIQPAEFSAGYTDQQGKPRPCFSLPPREVKILITGYDVVRRAKVIDRLEQLETGVRPKNFVQALRAYADEVEQKERLQLQLQATEVKVGALEVTLDIAELHASVKKMEARYGRSFPWHPLKDYSLARGYAMPKVFDQNYERGVNSYHDDVWRAVYQVTTRAQQVIA
jgi:phage regulator Rha-like protein